MTHLVIAAGKPLTMLDEDCSLFVEPGGSQVRRIKGIRDQYREEWPELQYGTGKTLEAAQEKLAEKLAAE